MTTDSAPVRELDVRLPNGGVLRAYDRLPTGASPRLALVWHHSTPNIGTPPAPLFAAADRLGIRWIGYDRPGYGGSTRRPDRNVASAADDVRALADTLDVERFAVIGHSGGGTHALASAARLADRVVGVAAISALAPFAASGLDWFAGMSRAGEATLRAAAAGRAAKEAHEETATEDDPGFVAADWDALAGDWSWFHDVVQPALAGGPGGLIEDDLAYVAPWGFDPTGIVVPVLLLHGDEDRIAPVTHAEWLARHIPTARLWRMGGDGHISVLREAESALEWLAELP